MCLICDVHVALLPYTYHAACSMCACEMHTIGMYVCSVWVVHVGRVYCA